MLRLGTSNSPFSRTWLLALLSCVHFAQLTEAQQVTDAYLWGIGNDNNIYQYNPQLVTAQGLAFVTGLTTSSASNGVAFDQTRYDLYWGHGSAAPLDQHGLYYWRQGVGASGKIATLAEIGLTGQEPFNAYFYNDYYWFMVEQSPTLRRIKINYDIETGLPVSVSWNQVTDDFAITLPAALGDPQALTQVDTALHVPTQTIYGMVSEQGGGANTPLFFKIDASDLNNLQLVIIRENILSNQNLAFDADYTTLYGGRSPGFVSINLQTGAFTSINLQTGRLLRDLGGSSPRSAIGLTRNIVFGVNEFNDIMEYAMDFKTSRVGLTTSLKNGNLYSNGVAFDEYRTQIFWAYTKPPVSPDDADNGLYVWIRNDRDNVAETKIALLSDLGVTASRYPFANALYYNDAYWFILNEQQILRSVPIMYDVDGLPTGVDTYIDYPLTGISYDLIKFGDIAYNANTKTLYGAITNRGLGFFFSIYDLDTLSTSSPNQMNIIKTGNPTLQLAFTGDYATLYGHDTQTGIWYIVDTSTGNLTPANFKTYGASSSSRDLAGSAFV